MTKRPPSGDEPSATPAAYTIGNNSDDSHSNNDDDGNCVNLLKIDESYTADGGASDSGDDGIRVDEPPVHTLSGLLTFDMPPDDSPDGASGLINRWRYKAAQSRWHTSDASNPFLPFVDKQDDPTRYLMEQHHAIWTRFLRVFANSDTQNAAMDYIVLIFFLAVWIAPIMFSVAISADTGAPWIAVGVLLTVIEAAVWTLTPHYEMTQPDFTLTQPRQRIHNIIFCVTLVYSIVLTLVAMSRNHVWSIVLINMLMLVYKMAMYIFYEFRVWVFLQADERIHKNEWMKVRWKKITLIVTSVFAAKLLAVWGFFLFNSWVWVTGAKDEAVLTGNLLAMLCEVLAVILVPHVWFDFWMTVHDARYSKQHRMLFWVYGSSCVYAVTGFFLNLFYRYHAFAWQFFAVTFLLKCAMAALFFYRQIKYNDDEHQAATDGDDNESGSNDNDQPLATSSDNDTTALVTSDAEAFAREIINELPDAL
jgi:hypothetical protein